jgi:hypothetical protein
MVLRIQVVDGEYRVVAPPEAVEALKLSEGVEVEVVPVAVGPGHRDMDFAEGMAAFGGTLEFHRDVYRELAK